MQDDGLRGDAPIGTELDGYRITGVLGRGGMGVVYAAEDLALGRLVALKMIDPAFARDEFFLRRLQSEARALARIDEPHIVQIYTMVRTDRRSFIVMELVDGGTLGDRFLEGPFDVEAAIPIIRQMLVAFGHAHALGVIHRDIKPGNIMLTRDGVVKVTDFGLAKVQQGQPAATVTQAVAGTLYYMSPEQVKGLPTLDHRSDLYSLGMTIYEMLAGRLPFDRQQGEFETMRIIVEASHPPPSRFNAMIAPELSRIVMKALEKDPNRRYQSASAMLADVEAFAARDDGTRVATPVAQGHVGDRNRFAARRRPLVLGSIAAGVLLIAGAGAWVLVGGDPPTASSPPGVAIEPSMLAVSTTPVGAVVFLDGRRVGLAPVVETVAGGGRAVRVQVEMEGYYPVDTLIVPQGDAVPIDVVLRARGATPTGSGSETLQTPSPESSVSTGTLSIRLGEGGVARLGDRTYRSNTRLTLTPGTYVLQCGTAPFDLSTRYTVRAGDEELASCYFEASISLNTQMEDGSLAPSAAIVINGEDTGLFTPTELVRGPGSYRVTVRKFGYDALDEESVVIRPMTSPHEPRRLVFRLRRQ